MVKVKVLNYAVKKKFRSEAGYAASSAYRAWDASSVDVRRGSIAAL